MPTRIAMARPHDDRGAVAVIVAILMMVFILFAALTVDIGYWYNVRRQLQSSADAAALAGCWELIRSGCDAEQDPAHLAGVLNAARTYADRNAIGLASGLHMIDSLTAANPDTGHPYTEVTNRYVKVTVEATAPALFAAVLGYKDGMIRAQARADAQWMTGMKDVAPFSLPFIDLPARLTVSVGDGPSVDLVRGGDGTWRATGVIVPAATATTVYPLHITAWNHYGIPTYLVTKGANDGVGVIRRASTDPYTDVWLDRYEVCALNDVPSDPGVTIHIDSAEKPKELDFDGKKYNSASDFQGASGHWWIHVPSPSTDYLSESFPVAIRWGAGANAVALSPAAWVVARRSSFPIHDVAAAPHVLPLSGGAIDVAVDLMQLRYEQEYSLKVVASGAEVGNFCSIDLDGIYHSASNGSPMTTPEYDPSSQDPNYQSPTYKHYLANAFPFYIHIGDYIWTYPGAEPQPTSQGLIDRFAGDANLTYAQWDTAGRPLTKRLLYVPLVEKVQETTGRSLVRVIAITSFYVEPAADYRGLVRGVFIEYVAGGQGSTDPPPSGFGVLTPRLVGLTADGKPAVDF